MSRFGQLSFGQKERAFIGQPVEDIAMVNQVLTDRYHANVDQIDKLQILESNIDLIDDPNDKAILRSQIDRTNKTIKDVSESGAYEHAGTVVRSAYKDFQTNKGLQLAQQARQQQKTWHTELDEREDLSPDQKGVVKEMARKRYQGTRQDERGEWIGGYNVIDVPEKFDEIKFTDDLLKGIKANKDSNEAWDLGDPRLNEAMTMYAEKHGITVESITEDRVADIVLNALEHDEGAKAWSSFLQEVDYYKRFESKGIIPSDEQLQSLMYSRLHQRQAILRTIPNEGETKAQAQERASEEYLDSIESNYDLMWQNTITNFEKAGVEYDNEDIAATIHAKVFQYNRMNNVADIMATKYGYSSVTRTHDIRTNEMGAYLRTKQDEQFVSLFDGWDIAVRWDDLQKNDVELNDTIIGQKNELKRLKQELENIPVILDANGIETEENRNARQDKIKSLSLMINDNEKSLGYLEAQKEDSDRIFDKYSNLVDDENVIGIFNTLKSEYGLTDIHMRVIKDSIRNRSSFEEMQKEMLDLGIINNPDSMTASRFKRVYNRAVNTFKNTVKKQYEQNPETITSVSINTTGVPRIDHHKASIEEAILGNLAGFTDMHSGLNLNHKNYKEAIEGATDVSINLGMARLPGHSNELVFHVTITKEDGTRLPLTVSAHEFQGQVSDELLTGLEEVARNPNTSPATRHKLLDIIDSQRGGTIKANDSDLYTSFVKSNYKNLNINEVSRPITTDMGDITIKKITDGITPRYKVFLKTGLTNIDLSKESDLASEYVDTPEALLATVQRLYRKLQ